MAQSPAPDDSKKGCSCAPKEAQCPKCQKSLAKLKKIKSSIKKASKDGPSFQVGI